MDWDRNNDNHLRNFVSVTDHSSIGFLYDYHHNNNHNNNHHFPSNSAGAILMGDLGSHHEPHVGTIANYGNAHHLQHLHGNNDQKKKKMRSDQIKLLENSFQEEIKLDPDRKIRLSRELGLQPRQIAVWFQNRRARWKAKQLERLYDSLKLKFDAVSREKRELLEEVLRLKEMVAAEPTKKQPSAAGQTEISGEEMLESARNSNEVVRHPTATVLTMNATGSLHHRHHHHHMVPESGYQLSNVQESYNVAAVMNSYWTGSEGLGGLPSYP